VHLLVLPKFQLNLLMQLVKNMQHNGWPFKSQVLRGVHRALNSGSKGLMTTKHTENYNEHKMFNFSLFLYSVCSKHFSVWFKCFACYTETVPKMYVFM